MGSLIISLIFKKYPCSCLNWPTLSYPAKDSHLPVVKTAQKGGPIYNLGGPFYDSIRYYIGVFRDVHVQFIIYDDFNRIRNRKLRIGYEHPLCPLLADPAPSPSSDVLYGYPPCFMGSPQHGSMRKAKGEGPTPSLAGIFCVYFAPDSKQSFCLTQ